MSNYSNTKATIAANVYTNHNNEVTAAMVKAGINAVVDTLIAGGFIYKGVAHPGDAAVSPDANVFYIASEAGTYTNKGGLVVADGEVAILKYNGSWSKEVTGAATAAEVTALGHEVGENTLGRMMDGRIEFEQGAIAGSGGNSASTPTLWGRMVNAAKTPSYICLPAGYRIREVYYYSAWTNPSSFTLSTYKTANAQDYTFDTSYPLVRIAIRKSDGSAFDIEDFIRDASSTYKKIAELNENIFGPLRLYPGYLSANTGDVMMATGWNHSDYIPIDDILSEKIELSQATGSSSAAAAAVIYDSAKSIIQILGRLANPANKTVITATGAKYIRFSFTSVTAPIYLYNFGLRSGARTMYETLTPIATDRMVAFASRASISVGTNSITFGTGYFYGYNQKGVERNKRFTEETTYTLSGTNNALVVTWGTNLSFSTIPAASIAANQAICAMYDAVTGVQLSGKFAAAILANRVSVVEGEVANIESDSVPDFVKTAGDTTFARLQSWTDGDDVYLLGQVTDIHSGGNDKYRQVGYLNALNDLYNFSVLCNAGDIGLDYQGNTETDAEAYALIAKTKAGMNTTCPWIFCKGNHERHRTSADIGACFNKPSKRLYQRVILGSSDGCYGYVDDEFNNVRTYFLNTTDAAVDTHYGMSATQLQWLADSLAQVVADRRVVVTTHCDPDQSGAWVSEPTIRTQTWAVAIRALLAAFVAKTAGTDGTLGVTWDFTSSPATAKLVCVLAGDSHFNNYAVTDGVNYIVRQGYGGVSDSEMPSGATKDTFNYNSQCLFDVLAVKANGTAKVFRIGAGGSTRDLAFTY